MTMTANGASSSPVSAPPPRSAATSPTTWDAILAGRSGARTMPYDWVAQYELPVTFAATIKPPPDEVADQGRGPPPGPLARQYALIASREAWADAGTPEVDPERLAVAHRLPASAASGPC